MKKMSAGRVFRLVAFAASAALAAGCSTATDAGKSFVDAQGNHPAEWVSVHPSYALPDGTKCAPCHGDDLRGGISGVSCFSASVGGVSCHAEGPAFHPADWVQTHRVAALPDGASCTPCHGSDLRGGALAPSCFLASFEGISCHATGPAFHPATWLDCTSRGTNGWHATAYGNNIPPCANCHDVSATSPKCTQTCHFSLGGAKVPSGSTYSHGFITGHSAFDADNAARTVCVNCHETHNRFGQPPVCHNCHAPFPTSHPAGWSDPLQHGAAAKKAPSSSAGFSFCATCHGADYGGGASGTTCRSTTGCHFFDAPHPQGTEWRLSTFPTHRTTNEGNASACASCHQSAAGTPGCFNNTLCHGAD